MAARTVTHSIALDARTMSPGFTARSLRGGMLAMDPFLNVDEFHMSEPTFPPHPHAGFSAVTYLFERSPGAFVNRDSLGDRSRIGPGALHWTQAARGMMHEEIPEHPGTDCHGLQMFVNLRAADKDAPPRALHLDAEQVPVVSRDGARVRVLAGSFQGLHAPLDGLLTHALLLDVQLDPDASVTLGVNEGDNVFALAIAGDGTADTAGAPVSAHRALGFSREGDSIVFTAGTQGLHVMVFGGTPIGEPVVFGGPFAMTSRADIERAYQRFRNGEMGRLDPSF